MSLTISATGDGTYNLSVEIIHGYTGLVNEVLRHPGEDQRQYRDAESIWNYTMNLLGGQVYHVVVKWENLGKSRKVHPDPGHHTIHVQAKFNDLKGSRSYQISCMWRPLV